MTTLQQIQTKAFQRLEGSELLTAGKMFLHISNEEKNEALKRLDPENLAYALSTWTGICADVAVESLSELNDKQLFIALSGSPNFCTASELDSLRFAACLQFTTGEVLFDAINTWLTDEEDENYLSVREGALNRLEGKWLLEAVIEWFNEE